MPHVVIAMDKASVVIYGLGYIGREIAKTVLQNRSLELMGAIDIDPRLIGRDVGEILGQGSIGVYVEKDAEKILKEVKPEIVLHATGSFLNIVYSQLERVIKHGANIVSTCETLAYPWFRYPELASKLDKLAKKHGVTVLGSGVNPGFIFDTLPIFLSITCRKINKFKIIRSINASKRRYTFQRKIGLGLSAEEFKMKMEKGEITGHVGYAESIMLIAKALNMKIAKIYERQEPIVSEKCYETEYFNIKPGQVIGIKGLAKGYTGSEEEIISLEFIASLNQIDKDEIHVKCEEHDIVWISNGIPGDYATASIIVNLAPIVIEAKPGLLTMVDLVSLKTTSYK